MCLCSQLYITRQTMSMCTIADCTSTHPDALRLLPFRRMTPGAARLRDRPQLIDIYMYRSPDIEYVILGKRYELAVNGH